MSWYTTFSCLSFFFWKRKAKNIYRNLVKPWNQNCTLKFTLQMTEDLYKKNSLHGYIFANTDITFKIMLFLSLSHDKYISYDFLGNLYILAWSCAWWSIYYLTAQPGLMLSQILLNNNNNINNSPQELLKSTHVQASLSKNPSSVRYRCIRSVRLDVWHLCEV